MKSKLLSRGFLSLMTTQFFGAVNDNLLKGVLVYMVIVGTLAAGMIADAYSPQRSVTGLLWLPGVAMVIVAVAGLVAVSFLPSLARGDRALKYTLNPLATYASVMKETAGKPLQLAIFAWGHFYFIAGLALLIIPEYSVVLQSFGVTRAEVSVLLGVMGVAVGVGSAVAGLISGHAIRPRLIPIGAAGLSIFFLLLAVIPPSVPGLDRYWRVLASPIAGLIFGAGFSAGFYIVPLQALLQRLSPDDERGRFLGTANCISFGFLLLASMLYWIIRPAFGESPDPEHPEKIFLVCSVMMVGGATFFIWRMKARGLSFAKLE